DAVRRPARAGAGGRQRADPLAAPRGRRGAPGGRLRRSGGVADDLARHGLERRVPAGHPRRAARRGGHPRRGRRRARRGPRHRRLAGTGLNARLASPPRPPTAVARVSTRWPLIGVVLMGALTALWVGFALWYAIVL